MTPERVAVLREHKLEVIQFIVPSLDDFEERAAIVEFDGGMSREKAEAFAAKLQGHDNVISFKEAIKTAKSVKNSDT